MKLMLLIVQRNIEMCMAAEEPHMCMYRIVSVHI